MDRAKTYPDRYQRYTGKQKLEQWLWTIGCAVVVLWAMRALEIEWSFLADAHVQAMDLIDRLWPPRWEYAPLILGPLIETIHIGTLGTMISFVLAVPVAFMSARNTSYNA